MFIPGQKYLFQLKNIKDGANSAHRYDKVLTYLRKVPCRARGGLELFSVRGKTLESFTVCQLGDHVITLQKADKSR